MTIGYGNNNGATTGGNIGDADKLLKLASTGKINPNAVPFNAVVCYGVTGANQNLVSVTNTRVQLNGIQEVFGVNDFCTITTGAGWALTLTKAGKYKIQTSVRIIQSATSVAGGNIVLISGAWKNSIATGNLITSEDKSAHGDAGNAHVHDSNLQCYGIRNLAIGDALFLNAYVDNAGGQQQIDNGDGRRHFFYIERIGD